MSDQGNLINTSDHGIEKDPETPETISGVIFRAVGTLPLYLPNRLALAMPSRCLSSMTSLSNWEIEH